MAAGEILSTKAVDSAKDEVQTMGEEPEPEAKRAKGKSRARLGLAVDELLAGIQAVPKGRKLAIPELVVRQIKEKVCDAKLPRSPCVKPRATEPVWTPTLTANTLQGPPATEPLAPPKGTKRRAKSREELHDSVGATRTSPRLSSPALVASPSPLLNLPSPLPEDEVPRRCSPRLQAQVPLQELSRPSRRSSRSRTRNADGRFVKPNPAKRGTAGHDQEQSGPSAMLHAAAQGALAGCMPARRSARLLRRRMQANSASSVDDAREVVEEPQRSTTLRRQLPSQAATHPDRIVVAFRQGKESPQLRAPAHTRRPLQLMSQVAKKAKPMTPPRKRRRARSRLDMEKEHGLAADDANSTSIFDRSDNVDHGNPVRRHVTDMLCKVLRPAGDVATSLTNDGPPSEPNTARDQQECLVVAQRLERGLFTSTVQPSGDLRNYKMRARSLAFNLRKNEELRRNLLSGKLPVKQVMTMSSWDLAHRELQKKREEEREKYFKEEVFSVSCSQGPTRHDSKVDEDLKVAGAGYYSVSPNPAAEPLPDPTLHQPRGKISPSLTTAVPSPSVGTPSASLSSAEPSAEHSAKPASNSLRTTDPSSTYSEKLETPEPVLPEISGHSELTEKESSIKELIATSPPNPAVTGDVEATLTGRTDPTPPASSCNEEPTSGDTKKLIALTSPASSCSKELPESLSIGSQARLAGLQSTKCYNGCLVELMSKEVHRLRYVVQLVPEGEGKQAFAQKVLSVKPSNLVPLPSGIWASKHAAR